MKDSPDITKLGEDNYVTWNSEKAAEERPARSSFGGEEDNPVVMWNRLEVFYVTKRPIGRFNTYDDLFSIRKEENETLSALTTRIEATALQLVCMAMIRALPSEFQSFCSALLLLDSLDVSSLREVFQNEEIGSNRRAEDEAKAS
ncbi:hypothetical protein FA95DRAFT_1612364 [Auriscalpium vulgare]|uniref:Uncharacterized protein n=1 Tax=Auriscalpium vulgare TaxID=40419 RepID=A0ACB8R7E8_9AGAM|nr:hypothetical protein FA95DRAFT_1612364 [Auriscalpium vulgare]